MRRVFLRLGAVLGLLDFSSFVIAAPRGYAIDLDASSPTLGELLDREAREAAEARARAKPPATHRPPPAQAPETTGSAGRPVVTTNPQIPRGAVTVILPHPKVQAGRPLPRAPELH